MGRSQETFNKKEKEKKRAKKREEKAKKREERKANKEATSFEDMIAYVDEHGNITDAPPDPTKKKEVIDASSIELGVPKREKTESLAVRTGRIDFFNDEKGYGFIKEENSHESFFVHVNGLIHDVREGDKVTFELEQGLKGLNAVRVQKV